MTYLPTQNGGADDDIDKIVDALVADPSRADDIKSLLRGKLAAPESVNVAYAAPSARAVPAQTDLDDMWDNVPI